MDKQEEFEEIAEAAVTGLQDLDLDHDEFVAGLKFIIKILKRHLTDMDEEDG